jgi:MarR family transcriptional regulator, lower aerobic nicotinate degradation pathway regulator
MSTLRKTSAPDDAGTARCPWGADGSLPAALPLEDYPGTMLLRLAQAMQQEISATYTRAHGLSVTEWRLLARLHAEGPMQLADLCRALAMDKAYASRMLRALTLRGYLEVSGDPEHGRRLIVTITTAGRALARRLLPKARDSQQQLLQVLDADERAVLYGAIKKLQAAVDGGLVRATGLSAARSTRRTG